MPNFFYVPWFKTPGSGPVVTNSVYKHVQCGACGIRPMGRVGSITVRFTRKGDLLDFSATAAGILIRPSVADHLTEARISGWRAGAVKTDTASRLRDQDVTYYEFIVIGHTRGYGQQVGLSVEYECAECGYRSYTHPEANLTVPESCWDRSDVFAIDELGMIVVTEAFRQAVKRYQHTGIEFVPLSEWRPSWMA